MFWLNLRVNTLLSSLISDSIAPPAHQGERNDECICVCADMYMCVCVCRHACVCVCVPACVCDNEETRAHTYAIANDDVV